MVVTEESEWAAEGATAGSGETALGAMVGRSLPVLIPSFLGFSAATLS